MLCTGPGPREAVDTSGLPRGRINNNVLSNNQYNQRLQPSRPAPTKPGQDRRPGKGAPPSMYHIDKHFVSIFSRLHLRLIFVPI